MCTSGPRPQNPCPLGLPCDRRIESSESGWTRRRSMRTLGVVRNAMHHFQMDLHGGDDPTSERLGGTSQDTAVASRAPLGGAIVE